jgi:hypothetical protein
MQPDSTELEHPFSRLAASKLTHRYNSSRRAGLPTIAGSKEEGRVTAVVRLVQRRTLHPSSRSLSKRSASAASTTSCKSLFQRVCLVCWLTSSICSFTQSYMPSTQSRHMLDFSGTNVPVCNRTVAKLVRICRKSYVRAMQL